jgi:hypothetical protein
VSDVTQAAVIECDADPLAPDATMSREDVMRVPVALAAVYCMVALCGIAPVAGASDLSPGSASPVPFEVHDYPGAYAQRFDGIDKGGSGLGYQNRFTAIPSALPGNGAALGNLDRLRSLGDLMAGPRGLGPPGVVPGSPPTVRLHSIAPVRSTDRPAGEARPGIAAADRAPPVAATDRKSIDVPPGAGSKAAPLLGATVIGGKAGSRR